MSCRGKLGEFYSAGQLWSSCIYLLTYLLSYLLTNVCGWGVREPKEGMTETVSHTFKRELDHVKDRQVMHELSRVINGSVDNSVYVSHFLLCTFSLTVTKNAPDRDRFNVLTAVFPPITNTQKPKPNVQWIGRLAAEVWPFDMFQDGGSAIRVPKSVLEWRHHSLCCPYVHRSIRSVRFLNIYLRQGGYVITCIYSFIRLLVY